MDTNNIITTNTVTGKKTLSIFENFIVDHSLPKFAENTLAIKDANGLIWGAGVTLQSVSPFVWGSDNKSSSFWSAIKNLFRRGKQVYLEYRSTPVEEVFAALNGHGKRLAVLTNRLEIHNAIIKEAELMGQTALAEDLRGKNDVVKGEAVLVASGFEHYIPESLLIDFVEKCEKGLRLDWIKNFTRIIPKNIRTAKTRFDLLKVFDNYVILHFDPNNNGSKLTQKEIEKKKDPILFGVIKGSTKLYHVGSWKDEYCDLAFDDLVEKYGEKVLTLE